MALGAPRNSILKMIVRQGMRIVPTGIAIGLVCAAGLTKVMSSMLCSVSPGDAATFFSVAAAIAFTALLACVGPAVRAALADPMVSIRNE